MIGKTIVSSEPKKVNHQHIVECAANLEKMGAFYALSANVHRYTRKIGDHYRTCFSKIDAEYQISAPGDFNLIYDDILKYSGLDPLVRTALDTIKSSAGKIEHETGINVQDLLVRTWGLAKKLGSYAHACDVVVDNLKQNKLTGGGCLAGITGRLVLPYSMFINHALNENFFGEYDAPIAPMAPRYDDEDMERAIALSLSEIVRQPEIKKLPIEEKTLPVEKKELTKAHSPSENDDFNLALALSASLTLTPAKEIYITQAKLSQEDKSLPPAEVKQSNVSQGLSAAEIRRAELKSKLEQRREAKRLVKK